MPSPHPRLALTLPDDLKRIIDDLADAMDKPSSKVVTALLQEMAPQLVDLTKIIRATKAGNKVEAKRSLVHMVGNAYAELWTSTQGELPLKGRKS